MIGQRPRAPSRRARHNSTCSRLSACLQAIPPHHVLDASKYGAAWFYATTDDLSSQLNWSVPQEIAGSWSQFTSTMDGGTIPAACEIYKGWYPTFMSPRRTLGRLNTTGYVFYSWGCQQGDTPAPGREFSSRRFTITTTGGQSQQ